MKKLMKNRNVMLYLYLLIGLIVLLVWRGGNEVTTRLSQIEFKRLERTQSKPVSLSTASFYPVWYKQSAAVKAAEGQDAVSVDTLFKTAADSKPVVEAPVAPPEPDYPAIIRQSVSVDAISENGAVLNGRFYPVGAPVDALNFAPAGSGVNAPVLTAVTGKSATIRLGKVNVQLALAPSN